MGLKLKNNRIIEGEFKWLLEEIGKIFLYLRM